jgi:hypothetical protein
MGDNPAVKARLVGLDALLDRDQRWYLDEWADEAGADPSQSKRAKKVNEAADRHWQNSRSRREDYARYWSMYLNEPVRGLTPRRFTHRTMVLARRKLSFNGCRSVPDSFVAEVTDQNPRVSFTTSGGSWKLRQRAKTLESFNDGCDYEHDSFEQGRLLMLDAAVIGTAVETYLPEGDGEAAHIVEQRDMAGDYFTDDEAAHYGDPREMYRRRYYDRLVAMAMFSDEEKYPGVAAAIAKASRRPESDGDRGQSDPIGNQTDTVCLQWAWHLPSGMGVWGRTGNDTGDGMLVITCDNVKCCEQPITRYPFEFLYVTKPPHGIWGDGFVAQLMPMQWELDDLLKMTAQSMKMSGLRLAVDSTANVNTMSLAGIANSVLKFTEKPPIPMVWPAVAPEVYQQMDRIWQRMFEVPGISQLQSQGKAPEGINSDRQLQTTLDVTSRRFQVSFRLYQNFHLRRARQRIALAREIAEENPNYAVKSITRKTMKVVKWADANMDDQDFAMKEYATSAFALTPEAKMQQIQDSLNSGSPLISPQEGRRLLNDPDLDSFDALKDASYNLIMDQISDILNDGTFNPPVPQMNLNQGPDSALTLAQFHLLEALRYPDVPKERIAMLEDWIQQVMDLIPPPPAPPGPPPGAPPPGGIPAPGPAPAMPPPGMAPAPPMQQAA